MRFRALVVLGLGAIVLGWSHHALAVLDLSFGQPSYSIDIGQTLAVPVFLSQAAGGPQAGAGNELLTANIIVSFGSPAGIAAVLLPGNVAGGPAFDSVSSGVTSTAATLSELSLSGIGNFSNPLLLGTFVFTGQAAGATMISVSELDPGSADFITSGGDVLDPVGAATASVSVGSVPEPAPYMIWSLLVLAGVVVGSWRHKRTTAVRLL